MLDQDGGHMLYDVRALLCGSSRLPLLYIYQNLLRKHQERFLKVELGVALTHKSHDSL